MKSTSTSFESWKGRSRKNYSVEKTLREQLDEAVAQEDYELAARLPRPDPAPRRGADRITLPVARASRKRRISDKNVGWFECNEAHHPNSLVGLAGARTTLHVSVIGSFTIRAGWQGLAVLRNPGAMVETCPIDRGLRKYRQPLPPDANSVPMALTSAGPPRPHGGRFLRGASRSSLVLYRSPQFLLVDEVVDPVVAGPAEVETSIPHLLGREPLAEPGPAVVLARDQVMESQRLSPGRKARSILEARFPRRSIQRCRLLARRSAFAEVTADQRGKLVAEPTSGA